jgi:hypothetical protein
MGIEICPLACISHERGKIMSTATKTKYANNGFNVGGLLDPAITWNTTLLAFLTLRPNHVADEGEDKLAQFNSELVAKFGATGKDVQTKEAMKIAEEICPGRFAREFSVFIANMTANLPKLSEIWSDPSNTPVPTDIHYQYVVASALAKSAQDGNIHSIARYLARLLPDIAAMASHDIERAFPELVTPELKALQPKK